MSSEASFSCELPTEVPVAEFKVEIEKPSFEGEDLTDNEGSLTLGTIIDGSTTEALEFGSEVVVYLEHEIPTGFTVSFASEMPEKCVFFYEPLLAASVNSVVLNWLPIYFFIFVIITMSII